MEIHGYAAYEPKGRLEPYTYDMDISQQDIAIQITHCGVGHGDIDYVNNLWGGSTYPLVPGHEMIGIVQETGDQVAGFQVGDRVGVGYEVASCMQCEYCLRGEENFCQQQKVLFMTQHGGFADRIVVNKEFVFHIPDTLDSAMATPLLCSGLTTYAAIQNYDVQQDMRTAVVGMGGLGHLAIQFLHALGCEVTVFSHDKRKEAISKELGAQTFISDIASNEFLNYFDFILVTTTTDQNWTAYIKMLTPTGKLCFVGLPEKDVQIPIPLLADYAQRSVCGSYIGNRRQTKEVLEFAAMHKIKAIVETFPMKDINEVIEKVNSGEVLFRAVVTNEKL